MFRLLPPAFGGCRGPTYMLNHSKHSLVDRLWPLIILGIEERGEGRVSEGKQRRMSMFLLPLPLLMLMLLLLLLLLLFSFFFFFFLRALLVALKSQPHSRAPSKPR